MTDFRYSKHVESRMQQRARTQDDIEFVLENGTDVEGGILLSKHDASEMERSLKKMIERAHRLAGTYVAVGGDTIKTTFKASDTQIRFILKGRTKRYRCRRPRGDVRSGYDRNSR